jgi:ankyrin repeat protein
LLDHGADANAKDKLKDYGDSCLMQAAAKGHLEIVKALLAKGGRVNDANQKGYTPLIYASWFGHVETVKALLGSRANVSARAKNGMTALMLAEKHRHQAVVELLRVAHKIK